MSSVVHAIIDLVDIILSKEDNGFFVKLHKHLEIEHQLMNIIADMGFCQIFIIGIFYGYKKGVFSKSFLLQDIKKISNNHEMKHESIQLKRAYFQVLTVNPIRCLALILLNYMSFALFILSQILIVILVNFLGKILYKDTCSICRILLNGLLRSDDKQESIKKAVAFELGTNEQVDFKLWTYVEGSDICEITVKVNNLDLENENQIRNRINRRMQSEGINKVFIDIVI